jgi:4-hydroxy-tetrahydrodipicolinate reductase
MHMSVGGSVPGRPEGRLRLALVGYGKMGRAVEEVALERGHQVVARLDARAEVPEARKVTTASLAGAEVAIEFTEPGAVTGNIERLLAGGIRSIVVGTTGWQGALQEVVGQVESAGAGLLYAYNFSLGINLFYRLVERAADLVDAVPSYDVFVEEIHHAAKKDRPSGTAAILADILLDRVQRKTTVVTRTPDGPAPAEQLPVISIRAGQEPGIHRVVLDSPADTLELVHRARTRRGFAEGAVLSAEWLHGQSGIFTFRDVLGTVL